jgi:hypothetical protein
LLRRRYLYRSVIVRIKAAAVFAREIGGVSLMGVSEANKGSKGRRVFIPFDSLLDTAAVNLGLISNPTSADDSVWYFHI